MFGHDNPACPNAPVPQNFLVSAGEGLKSICGAHDMHHHHNIYAYPWGG